MLLSLALGLALLQQGVPDTDTTLAVQPGARLVLNLATGDVNVRTWDRPQVRVQARHAPRTTVRVRSEGAVVRVEVQGRMGMPATTDLDLTIPVAMAVDLDGMSLTVEAVGMRGALKVGTLQGDMTVRDGAELDLSAMNGDLIVEGSRGRARLSTASGRITATGVVGDISAEAISGGVGLYRIESNRVDVEAVSGEIIYQGTVREGGSYVLGTHSGSVTFGMPANANATVNTATWSGNLSASFTMPGIEERSRSRQTVRFGSGSAIVELESFSGRIRLVRPDEVPAQSPRRERDESRHDRQWDRDADLDLDFLHDLDLSGLAGLASLGQVGVDVAAMVPSIRWNLNRDLNLNLLGNLRLDLRSRRDRGERQPPTDRKER